MVNLIHDSFTFWLRFKIPSMYLRITSDGFSSRRTGGRPVGAPVIGLLALGAPPAPEGIPQGYKNEY